MDKRAAARERIRRKRQQQRRRKMIRLGIYAVAVILGVIFLVKGIILPIAGIFIKSEAGTSVQVQAVSERDPDEAARQPLKGPKDLAKTIFFTPGWHVDENGTWYQNTDGTYFVNGFKEIDGYTYCFDENGYLQTGWVTKGVKDYYFNSDGSYNPDMRRPMVALTFDDGPGEYTDSLLACLEENNAHATFFMVGSNVGSYPDTVKKMLEIGCELGSHSWSHPDLLSISLEEVSEQFTKTDNALIEACGQAATVARAPYGSSDQSVYDTVQKPFFMWSLDSLDWSYRDVQKDYDAVMGGDLTDGSIILMHDIHKESVEAALRIIPDLVEKGYKLVTVSELAEAKDVELQYARYSDFWDSSLNAGIVAGYAGNEESSDSGSTEE